MTFTDMGSYLILNPYEIPYLPLNFVPLITNHPVYIQDAHNFALYLGDVCSKNYIPEMHENWVMAK